MEASVKSGRLSGRKVIVTGGASGIGHATARALHENGANVAVLDRNLSVAADLAKQIGASAFEVDVRNETSVVAAVGAAVAALGGLDGVVNAAGISSYAPLGDITAENWDNVLAVNLTGPFLVCKAALPALQVSAFGSIVNVASLAALMPAREGLSAYSASKGGVVAFSKALARELAPQIRVNSICPGMIDTPMASRDLVDVGRESVERSLKNYAMGRMGKPEEVANLIVFLISQESSFITGAAMTVDGGRAFH